MTKRPIAIALALFLPVLSACVAHAPMAADMLPTIDDRVLHELRTAAATENPDAQLMLHLRRPTHVDPAMYANPWSAANDKGLKSRLQELAILVDWTDTTEAAAQRPLSRIYENAVRGANCDARQCTALVDAQQLLRAPRLPPFDTRLTWSDWRPVSALPPSWAETTQWNSASIHDAVFDLEMEYLIVWLQRGWLSEAFLSSPGWYLAGECAHSLSDGDPSNDRAGHELMPRIPVGFVLSRRVEAVQRLTGERLELHGTFIVGWFYRPTPASPPLSDPCESSCAGRTAGRLGCAEVTLGSRIGGAPRCGPRTRP